MRVLTCIIRMGKTVAKAQERGVAGAALLQASKAGGPRVASCGRRAEGVDAMRAAEVERCAAKSWKSALVCIGNMRKGGVAPGTPAYNIAIKACMDSGEADHASALLTDMHASGATPDEVTLAAMRSPAPADATPGPVPAAAPSRRVGAAARDDVGGSTSGERTRCTSNSTVIAGPSATSIGDGSAASQESSRKTELSDGWNGSRQLYAVDLPRRYTSDADLLGVGAPCKSIAGVARVSVSGADNITPAAFPAPSRKVATGGGGLWGCD